ncbi:MAG: hypothetical protein A3G35_14005 [candidate division NC10 bacterium RIFCSPLOWO2_12_FULL_66_18]|nr:MAG: hypothetical protein A3G35_14005 [candidate division NC10 bacterium RIFCSPLOWO2_12_FULL_66_18]
MPHAVREAVGRLEPAVDVQVMGEPGSPSLEAEDPDLLAWIEREGRILVTRNRRSMPTHFAALLEAGGHVPGILMVGEDFSVAQLSEDLLLIWGASEAEERRDRLVYLPLVSR